MRFREPGLYNGPVFSGIGFPFWWRSEASRDFLETSYDSWAEINKNDKAMGHGAYFWFYLVVAYFLIILWVWVEVPTNILVS